VEITGCKRVWFHRKGLELLIRWFKSSHPDQILEFAMIRKYSQKLWKEHDAISQELRTQIHYFNGARGVLEGTFKEGDREETPVAVDVTLIGIERLKVLLDKYSEMIKKLK
jgi:hypothetical protein